MPIVVNLDVMMAKRKMSLGELSAKVDLTLANKKQPCQGGTLLYPRGPVQGAGLSAWGYPGVCAGRRSLIAFYPYFSLVFLFFAFISYILSFLL